MNYNNLLYCFLFLSFFLLHNLNSDIRECKSILRIRYKTNQFIEFYVETFIKFHIHSVSYIVLNNNFDL